MKKSKNILWAIYLLILPTAFVFAQASSGYESSESFSYENYSANNDCVGCDSISGQVVSGQVANGDLSGTVNAQPVYGGGGGSVVPIAQQYATPTDAGGGYVPSAEYSTSTPGLPNTGLGDDKALPFILAGMLFLLGEILILSYRKFRKI